MELLTLKKFFARTHYLYRHIGESDKLDREVDRFIQLSNLRVYDSPSQTVWRKSDAILLQPQVHSIPGVHGD